MSVELLVLVVAAVSNFSEDKRITISMCLCFEYKRKYLEMIAIVLLKVRLPVHHHPAVRGCALQVDHEAAGRAAAAVPVVPLRRRALGGVCAAPRLRGYFS